MPDNRKQLTLSNYLLGEIEAAMNYNSYEIEWYLDVREEKATFLCDPMVTGEYEENEKLEQLIEQDEEGRFIAIPGTTSREAWKQMERFILSLDDRDETTRNLLLDTIRGSGAFSRFKDAMYRTGLQERWYKYKGREDRKEALNWLRSLDLITDEQVERGIQMYEEQIRKGNQRDKEISNMT